jgi:hypothetical protein
MHDGSAVNGDSARAVWKELELEAVPLPGAHWFRQRDQMLCLAGPQRHNVGQPTLHASLGFAVR